MCLAQIHFNTKLGILGLHRVKEIRKESIKILKVIPIVKGCYSSKEDTHSIYTTIQIINYWAVLVLRNMGIISSSCMQQHADILAWSESLAAKDPLISAHLSLVPHMPTC